MTPPRHVLEAAFRGDENVTPTEIAYVIVTGKKSVPPKYKLVLEDKEDYRTSDKVEQNDSGVVVTVSADNTVEDFLDTTTQASSDFSADSSLGSSSSDDETSSSARATQLQSLQRKV